MSYVDLKFLTFVIFTLLGLIVVGRLSPSGDDRRRSLWLFLMSLIFLVSWNWASALMVTFLGALSYWVAGRMADSKDHRKTWFYAGVFFQVLILIGFRDFKPLENTSYNFSSSSGLLLVGLSYVVFQNISYLSQVRHGSERGSFLGYMHFVTYFPKILMGPLADYRDFQPKISSSSKAMSRGVALHALILISLGLFKTLVVSQAIFKFNSMALEAYGQNVDSSLPVPLIVFWLASVMSWMMVYCDFSGCIDVARGTSKLLGIDLPENFNRPYLATNPVDYWQRWNITLVEWFRRHIYFPILLRLKNIYFATALTMAAIGFWHGAMKNMILWTVAWILVHFAYLWLRQSKTFVRLSLSPDWRRWSSVAGGLFIFHFSAMLGLLTILPIFYSSSVVMYKPDFQRVFDSGVIPLISKYPESFFLIPFVLLGEHVSRRPSVTAKILLSLIFILGVWRFSSGTSYLFYYLRL